MVVHENDSHNCNVYTYLLSAGAICGDPAKGAKMGAAAGATGGAMKGMGARRRRRMMG